MEVIRYRKYWFITIKKKLKEDKDFVFHAKNGTIGFFEESKKGDKLVVNYSNPIEDRIKNK